MISVSKEIYKLNKSLHLCNPYLVRSIISRHNNFSSSIKENTKLKTDDEKLSETKPFSESDNHTWVGPPHPESNLRLKVFPSSNELTKEEAHFYERSREIQDWNQEYWLSHNRDFEQSKKLYIKRNLTQKEIDSNMSLNNEQMADFYREFLNKNYKKHLSYNWQWYKRNFELIYLSAKAQISKLKIKK